MYEDERLTESGKKTRELIFRTAVEVLKKEGYDKLTIRKICAASGTSNGSFYHFFKNKDELLAYYYNISADRFIEEHIDEMNNATLSEQMMITYRYYIRYSADYGVDFCMSFFNAKNRAIDPAYMYNAFYEISRKYLHEKENELKEGNDADTVAKELCILAKGIIFDWATERGSYDITVTADRMFAAYLSGVVKQTD
jgi:AcrR family transcriptional regulator